jgi:uncharacterized membrane protein
MNFLAHIFVCGCLLVMLDATWIGVFAKRFYEGKLGRMLADSPRLAPGMLAYPIYVASLLYLALEPALTAHDFWYGIKHAAVLAFATFTMYSLTNRALLRRWPLSIVTVDIIWGVAVSVAVVAAGYAIFP